MTVSRDIFSGAPVARSEARREIGAAGGRWPPQSYASGLRLRPLLAWAQVHTAGEGVLAGTVRRLLLEVCEREGVPVVLEPPTLDSAAS